MALTITDAELVWVANAFGGDIKASYALYRDYYHGRHDLGFATPKFNKTFGALFKSFAYNRCGAVVDSLSNRLRVKGFQVSGIDLAGLKIIERGTQTAQAEGTDAGGVDYSSQAQTLWRLAGMDVREGEIYTEAGMMGDAYGVVYFDAPPPLGTGLPKLWPNRAEAMRVRYDDDGHINLAAKLWKVASGPDEGKLRLTIYTPTEIIRLITLGKKDEVPKALAEYALVKEVNALNQQVVNPVVHGLGRVPVVHYANNAPMLGDYGLSELRDVMPLQDALNKAIADMLVAMEYNAFPQRYAVGIESPVPDEGGKIVLPWKEGPGEVWYSTAVDAAFGSFDAANLEQFLKVQDQFDLDIARVSHTPVHWLVMTGTPPSGDSLKIAEAPFSAKARDRQRSMGASHAEAMSIKFQLMGVKEPLLIEVDWESAEPRSEREQAEIGKIMHDAGIPLHIVGRVMGLDEADLLELADSVEQDALSQERGLALATGQQMAGQLAGAIAAQTEPVA